MSTLRERVRASHPKSAPRRPRRLWEPPSGYLDGRVLAFDCSLTKTGWALVESDGIEVVVVKTGLLKPVSDVGLESFEETFAKALLLRSMLRTVVELWGAKSLIVHEMPAVYGHRLESSLLAAMQLRNEVDDLLLPMPLMVSKQRAASVVGGPTCKTKADVSRVVEALVRRPAGKHAWNQDVHDAVLLALYLLREISV